MTGHLSDGTKNERFIKRLQIKRGLCAVAVFSFFLLFFTIAFLDKNASAQEDEGFPDFSALSGDLDSGSFSDIVGDLVSGVGDQAQDYIDDLLDDPDFNISDLGAGNIQDFLEGIDVDELFSGSFDDIFNDFISGIFDEIDLDLGELGIDIGDFGDFGGGESGGGESGGGESGGGESGGGESGGGGSCSLPGTVVQEHNDGRTEINEHTSEEFNKHRDWLVEDFAKGQVIPALQLFTEQMSTVAMAQTAKIGRFLDAKHQLESQRLFQELQLQAHKDYQPSTAFCTFGTNVRSLAHSENVSRYNALALSQRQMARHLGQTNMAATSRGSDKAARWKQFTDVYCDPADNNWLPGTNNTGLSGICNAPAPETFVDQQPRNRVNIDIDYTRAVENKRTIDISRPYDVGSADEIDIQALGNNLYGHDLLFRGISRTEILKDDKPKLYMQLRSIAAKRAVAENSFNAIVGLKSLGSTDGTYDPGAVAGITETAKFMGAILGELGIPSSEIKNYIGLSNSGLEKDFSYYNQLEILAKKIYQSPNFYANLYDKPANVKRISTALKAIDLMLDRAIYESQIRQEMAMSVLLSARLQTRFEDLDKNLK